MTAAAGDNKKMPDGVIIRQLFPGVKDAAEGVKKAPGQQQGRTPGLDHGHQRFNRNYNRPAHAQVEQD